MEFLCLFYNCHYLHGHVMALAVSCWTVTVESIKASQHRMRGGQMNRFVLSKYSALPLSVSFHHQGPILILHSHAIIQYPRFQLSAVYREMEKKN
jgi:hypothetical protein